MTAEQLTPIIAAVIALIGAVTSWVKARTEIDKIKASRSETKESRDKDSQELHDKVLKLEFSDSLTKDTLLLHRQRIDEVNTATQQLTTQLAVVVTKLDNIIDVLNALKKDGK